MTAGISTEVVGQALSRLEARQAGLVAWGVTDAMMSRSEVDEVLLDFIDERGEYIALDELRDELLVRRLLLEVPESDGYRTRMAETVRTISKLRQTFRDEHWWEGRPLVLDYRFLTRPRSRPRIDIPRKDFIESGDSDVKREVLGLLAPPLLAGFQKRGTEEILAATRTGRPTGVVVTAGTGSGKTYAFYLPALAWVAESVNGDASAWLRALLLYPRRELLRDQLQNALRLTARLDASGVISRAISIGAWYGSTPTSPEFIGGYDEWREVQSEGRTEGWICPFLRCPRCNEDLIWTRSDVAEEIERLRCTGSDCDQVLGPSLVRLTRRTIQRDPPDLLFTTTESLNRQMSDSAAWKAFGIHTKPAPQFVLLDEIHTYEGLTGAQNAYLLRRYRSAVRGAPTIVGLSATLTNAPEFTAQLSGLRDDQVIRVAPAPEELETLGAEYMVALRHDSAHRTSPLSTTIQTVMALTRSIDRRGDPVSGDLYGHRMFVFGDRHDTINRLLWDTLDAEGWYGLSGRPRRGRGPQTLAHLRAEHQVRLDEDKREPALERLAEGQWWWHSERIGHHLDEDQQMRVARTTALDPGVSETADVVVATATLEVGYDDPGVGAIVQHKSPHDAARFIQRKGRAGRSVVMRPWTVVVLSDFGRDRLTWDTFEQLFEPELPPQHLPIGNRYVHRIQAVYSTMDWFADELSKAEGMSFGSTWRDLSEPTQSEFATKAQQRRRERQDALVDIINEVLAGGPAFDRLAKHLERSLGLGAQDLQAVLWSPPRALVMAVLPTARRRLDSQWRGEEPRLGTYGGTPLPEFVTSSQFGDLLTPEVLVSIPTSQGDPDVETTPVLSVLTEYLPGNVSRRHSIFSPQDRHWVDPPEGFSGEVDIVDSYNAEFVRQVEVRGEDSVERYDLYRPRSFSLAIPPVHIAESTSVRPIWRTLIEPLGTGSPLDLPESHWSTLIQSIRSHLHRSGDGVFVARLASGASGSTYVRGEYQDIRVSFKAPFTDEDAFEGPPPAALGMDFEADGIVLDLRLPEELPPVSSSERIDRLEHLVQRHPAFRFISIFDRNALAAVITAASVNAPGSLSELWALPEVSLRHQLVEGMGLLGTGGAWDPSVLEAGDDPEPSRLEVVWNSDEGIAAIREVAGALWRERDTAWDEWARRRLATTIGAVFLESLVRLAPDLDIEDLAVDVDASPESGVGATLWLTETAPGGNGFLEQVHAEIASDPARLLRLLDRSLQPTDVERLDAEVRLLLEMVSRGGECHQEADGLRRAWAQGHEKTAEAHRSFVDCVRRGLPTLARLSVVTLVSRILGPGSHPDLPAVCNEVVSFWDSLEDRSGLSIDSRIASAMAARELNLDPAVLHLAPDAAERRLALAVASLMWPRGRSAARLGLPASGRFGQESRADREALSQLVRDSTPILRVTQVDDETLSRVKEGLLHGRVAIAAQVDDASIIHELNLHLQSDPVEVGPLFAYPRLVGLSISHDEVIAHLVLPEALA